MRVIVGSFYHEATTFNPFYTDASSFTFVEGEESKKYVAATEIFENRGIEVIPTIFASAISSGSLTEETYRYFADKILKVFKREKNIDGIWMHLHGSMEVVGMGSGEALLLREIREIIGNEIPISLTLDFHGNIDDDIPKLANIIRGYRTAPHIDREETEMITANLLVDCLEKGTKHRPTFERIPMITTGEKALTDVQPMKTILRKLAEYEAMEGILLANYFNGHAWSDAPNVSASVLVVPESEEYEKVAEKVTKQLAEFIYDLRHEFKFEVLTLAPSEAIDRALSENVKPIFIADSGDNTTGGAAGINTVLLRYLTEKDLKEKRVLVAAVFDQETGKQLSTYQVGEKVMVNIGVNYDQDSAPVKIKGILKAKGDLLGFATAAKDRVGDTYTVSIGDLDVIIANRGDSFTTVNHFVEAGLDINDYDVIVVKQGYLFDELSEIAALEILALTQGATYQLIEELDYHHLIRPIYPLDK